MDSGNFSCVSLKRLTDLSEWLRKSVLTVLSLALDASCSNLIMNCTTFSTNRCWLLLAQPQLWTCAGHICEIHLYSLWHWLELRIRLLWQVQQQKNYQKSTCVGKPVCITMQQLRWNMSYVWCNWDYSCGLNLLFFFFFFKCLKT